MFWFLTGRSKMAKLEKRVEELERQSQILHMTLQSIQAHLSHAAGQVNVLNDDVREIQDTINHFVQQAEAAALLYYMNPDSGNEH